MAKRLRILVTGGAGFIGSNFIRYLLPDAGRRFRDIAIVNLDKLTYSGNIANLAEVKKDPRYRFVKGDICDRTTVNRIIRSSDIVVHFAAESHVDRSIRDATDFVRTNVLGTQVLLDAARAHAVRRFVHISTDEVYGSTLTGRFTESSALLPNSPYAASKAAADLLVRSYHATFGMPVVIIRSANNFGPYQYPEKIIPLFITNLLEGKKVPVYADGSNVRDWIYVKDTCAAIAFVMQHGTDGEIYNVSVDNGMPNLRLTKLILKMLRKPERMITFVKDRPGHDKRYALDVSKIGALGWRPHKRSFESQLRETVDWYTHNTTWWQRLKKKKERFW